MKEKVTDIANYLRENFFTIIVLIGFLTPALWWGCSKLNESTIESLNSQIETLKERNQLLIDKTNGYKELALQHDSENANWKKIESTP
jgi:hypothetical protein